MTRAELYGLLIAIVAFSLAALLPLVNTGYALSLGVTIAMYVVLSTSWSLFSGPTHYISLATAAFFGLGMYVVGGGLDMLPYPALVAIAALVGAGLAGLIGLATLRLSGIYFVRWIFGFEIFKPTLLSLIRHFESFAISLQV